MDKKIFLPESDIPKQWYNIAADVPVPIPPPLHPGTHRPVAAEDLAAIFPMPLIEQEVSTERWIDIPDEVRKIYSIWRPTPVIRAEKLEKYLDTPAHIYYKFEAASPAGSHKPNTAVAQAYYNKISGINKLSTETGAGQWGSALSFAGQLLGLEVKVWMVKVSYNQKPYRKMMMHTWGGTVYPSPSDKTEFGRKLLAEDPNNMGSLGLAISEAVEEAATHEDTNYALGSVLNHVLLHQTVIGLEAKKQMEIAGEYPDVVLAPCGGGSNLGGLAYPFLADKFAGKKVRAVAVEPASCPTLTKGVFRYDFGDVAQLTPLLKMYTLGHNFMPPGIHAGGLRYHGDNAIISLLVKEGLMEAVSVHQSKIFEAAVTFARTEGHICAPETAHAIAGAIDEALEAKKEGKKRVILFNYSGHGLLDLGAYDDYFAKKITDYEYPKSKVDEALSELPIIEDY